MEDEEEDVDDGLVGAEGTRMGMQQKVTGTRRSINFISWQLLPY